MWVENWGICRGEKKKKAKNGQEQADCICWFFFSLNNKKKKSLKSLKIWICGGGAAAWQRKLILKTTSNTESFVLRKTLCLLSYGRAVSQFAK